MRRLRPEDEDLPQPSGPPFVIGWKEYLDFPDWGVRRVKAKIDTGARTSAIHVAGYELYQKEHQGLFAELRMGLDRRRPEQITLVHAPVLRMLSVTDSGGHAELRPLIAARIKLGPVAKQVLLTVANRESMLFRMLLGRKALEGDFLVDVTRKYEMKNRQ